MATGTVYGNVHTETDYTYGERVYLNYTTSETGSTYTITCKVGIQAYTNALSLTSSGWAHPAASVNDTTYEASVSGSGALTHIDGDFSLAKGASRQILTKSYTYDKSKTGATSKTIYVASDISFVGYASVYNPGIFATKATTANSSYKAQAFTIPKRTSYTITYNANGGTGAPTNGTKWADEAYPVPSTIPTRAGYVFDKWLISQTGNYVNAGGSISAGSNNNYTLVAQWTPNTNTIQFDANGGTNAPTSQTGATASTITLTSDTPSRIGYDFTGWSTTSTGSAMYSAGGKYTVGTASTQTLYAIWRANYVPPTINNLTATRASYKNDTWVDDDDGSKLHVKWNYTQATEDGNSLSQTYKVGIKLSTSDTYTYTSVVGTDGIVDVYINDVTLDPDYMYDVQAVINVGSQTGGPDHSDSPVTRNTYISRAYYIIDVNPDGTGIAFGTVSSQTGFCCDMDAQFNNDLVAQDMFVSLDTTATTGTDKEIYDALVALGWDNDVIV